MPAPNLGPQYDLAARITALEDQVRRLQQNPLGQAFSATQSDGSVGWQIYQDPNFGTTAMVFHQGPGTPRDPNTNQHPSLLYIGQLLSGGTSVNSGAIFYRPDGSESMVIGNRGVAVLDRAGNIALSTDEDAGEGIGRPWIPLGVPASTLYAQWPQAKTSGLLAELFFTGQHPKVYWNGSVAGDVGVTGSVQMTITNGTQSVSGSSYTFSGTAVDISEVLTLPQPFFGESWTVQINASVTGGTGNLYCQTWELTGRQS